MTTGSWVWKPGWTLSLHKIGFWAGVCSRASHDVMSLGNEMVTSPLPYSMRHLPIRDSYVCVTGEACYAKHCSVLPKPPDWFSLNASSLPEARANSGVTRAMIEAKAAVEGGRGGADVLSIGLSPLARPTSFLTGNNIFLDGCFWRSLAYTLPSRVHIWQN